MDKIESIKRIPVIDQSIDKIKDYILKGDLKTGDFLPPEMELCKKIEIGRSSLRETQKTLEIQGFVKIKQGWK